MPSGLPDIARTHVRTRDSGVTSHLMSAVLFSAIVLPSFYKITKKSIPFHMHWNIFKIHTKNIQNSN